jgi:NitT/TauT family transport system substrate-binding protein
VVNALVAGDLEGAAISLDEAISVAAEGIPLEIILVFDVSDGADAIVTRGVTRNDSGLEHALKNDQIALNYGTTGRLLIDAAITNIGLDYDSLALINLAPDQQIKAWDDGNIDAAVTREPHLSQLIERGATPVFTSSEIRGRIVDVLVVREDRLDQHADHIHSLTQGFFKAQQSMKVKDSFLIFAQKRLNLPVKQLEKTYHSLHMPGLEENYRLLDKDNGRLSRTMETLTSLMQMNSMLSPQARPELKTSTKFLPVL